MDNRILRVEVHDRSLVPAEAEVWVAVTLECQSPTTELRGRLMGPRCAFASTVEVAYPLRSLPPGQPTPGLTMRVVIPEASLWDPESPFLYEGPVELWQDGRCCDRLPLRHGLRSFQLDARGLRVNGRQLRLRGRRVTESSEDEAMALRRDGYNLLVAPVRPETLPLWEMADRLGFLVLGGVAEENEETQRHMEELFRHASFFGWLAEGVSPPAGSPLAGCRMGMVAPNSPPGAAPPVMPPFLVGPASRAGCGHPLLVEGEVPAGIFGAPGILGTLD